MSVDTSFADDLASAAPTPALPSAAIDRFPVERVRGRSPLVLGAAAILIGAGVIAAVATGANVVLALLVGYSALASTVACLRPTAPSTPQLAAEITEAIDIAPAARDTAAAWKLVTTFTISDASRLLCNIEPGAAVTQESIAWGRALLDAIKQGELPLAPKAGAAQAAIDRERENPHYMTEVTREALRSWADRRGALPEFLRD
jgi:hypothetical protein